MKRGEKAHRRRGRKKSGKRRAGLWIGLAFAVLAVCAGAAASFLYLTGFGQKARIEIATGNHEYGYVRGDEGFTHFPEYFPFERNSKWADCVVSAFPNREGKVSLENAAYEFEDKAWGKMLVIAVEWAPRDEVLNWAKDLADNKYKDHKIMLLLHSFLWERTAERTENEDYRINPRNYGQDVWDKLVFPCKNIELVMCGHTGKPGDFEDNVAYRKDKNSAGKHVHQMMFNVQALGGGWEGNGGDGWLRILEFKPDGKTVSIKTYSPLFGISPTTKQFAHRTGKMEAKQNYNTAYQSVHITHGHHLAFISQR